MVTGIKSARPCPVTPKFPLSLSQVVHPPANVSLRRQHLISRNFLSKWAEKTQISFSLIVIMKRLYQLLFSHHLPIRDKYAFVVHGSSLKVQSMSNSVMILLTKPNHLYKAIPLRNPLNKVLWYLKNIWQKS